MLSIGEFLLSIHQCQDGSNFPNYINVEPFCMRGHHNRLDHRLDDLDAFLRDRRVFQPIDQSADGALVDVAHVGQLHDVGVIGRGPNLIPQLGLLTFQHRQSILYGLK